MNVKESVEGFDEKFSHMTEKLSVHPNHEEINEIFDTWCDLNLEKFDDAYELEIETLKVLEQLCLQYGVKL